MITHKYFLKFVYAFELVMFYLIVWGHIDRSFALALAAILIVYTLCARLNDGAKLFVASIPLFIALPLTDTFDNFNTWRILSLILILRWAWQNRKQLLENSKQLLRSPILFFKSHPLQLMAYGLLLMAGLSVFVAPDTTVAIKRIIYFVNLSFVGIVIYDLLRKQQTSLGSILRSMVPPVLIATAAGIVQLWDVYRMNIFQFIDKWGWGIQCRQFGEGWCTIAVEQGNTWFAYYGELLSLRVFSLFPDTHSFPIFLLLGLAAIYALSLKRIPFDTLRNAVTTRASMLIVTIPIVFFAVFMSGTRGFWAAFVGIMILYGGFEIYMRFKHSLPETKTILRYVAITLVFFMAMYPITQPIFSSPQFQTAQDGSLLTGRLLSTFDFGEKSNALRMKIWKATWQSIQERPILGVGIGNFPVVLDQDIAESRAGSSAHNLYLHIAAEMGIPALIISIILLLYILKIAYKNTRYKIRDTKYLIYNSAILFLLPWVLIYSLTDFALFDERAFLLFVVTIAILVSTHSFTNDSSAR